MGKWRKKTEGNNAEQARFAQFHNQIMHHEIACVLCIQQE